MAKFAINILKLRTMNLFDFIYWLSLLSVLSIDEISIKTQLILIFNCSFAN